MTQRTWNWRLPAAASKVFLCGSILTMAASCSDSGNDSANAPDIYAQVTNAAAPTADLAASTAVTTLSSQGSSDSAAAEVRSRYAAEVQGFKDNLCKVLGDSAKDVDDKEINNLQATAEQALRDSFVLQFVQTAAEAPADVQAKIVEATAMQSKGADGSPLTGGSALKDASITDAGGTTKIPSVGTAEYTKYADWLRDNRAFRGLILTLTEDYQKTLKDCAAN